jgi:hypothetical protein
LMAALASRLAPEAHARALVWALQLIPIAFVFRVRANQEYLLLAGMLLAIYGLERARISWGWIAIAVAGAMYALAVKGMFALLAPVVAGLWLWSRRARATVGGVAWTGLAVMALLLPVAAWGYEHAYRAVTDQSFLDYYLGARIALEGNTTQPWPFPIDKLANAGWYAGRVLWYAAPWSLIVLAAVLPTTQARLTRGSRAWVRFAVLAALVTIALVAARDTKADRYVFPAYFFGASAGVIVACARWPRTAAWAVRLDQTWPWGPAVLWLLLVAGRILA